MKLKMKKGTIKILSVIILSTLFSIGTNFIPKHNTLSYILGMIFMGIVYVIFELIDLNN